MQESDFEMVLDENKSSHTPVKIIYWLNMASVAIATLSLPAVVLAYVFRSEDDSWVNSHYRFQIRTFWMLLLYLFVAAVTTVAIIGFLLFPLIILWWLIRNAKGLKHLSCKEVHPNMTTWLW